MAGFADLGEVNLLKASAPFLHSLGPDQSARHIIHGFNRAQRLGMIAGMRPIEQTPELTFLMHGIVSAYPAARFLHLVRDGRDVVCSLLERGWLCDSPSGVALARGTGTTHDDAGQPFGNYARFWVEPERRAEFEAASEVTRAAWAWRRYTSAGIDQAAELPAGSILQVRYEQLVTDSRNVALEIVDFLGERDRANEFVSAFGKAHTRSHGRWRQELDAGQIAEFENEAGPLLAELGYV